MHVSNAEIQNIKNPLDDFFTHFLIIAQWLGQIGMLYAITC